jgi:hypothetical protein
MFRDEQVAEIFLALRLSRGRRAEQRMGVAGHSATGKEESERRRGRGVGDCEIGKVR